MKIIANILLILQKNIKSNTEKNIDYMLSDQIIKEINKFFKTRPKSATIKKKKKLFNKTIKLL